MKAFAINSIRKQGTWLKRPVRRREDNCERFLGLLRYFLSLGEALVEISVNRPFQATLSTKSINNAVCNFFHSFSTFLHTVNLSKNTCCFFISFFDLSNDILLALVIHCAEFSYQVIKYRTHRVLSI
jgi:hypothetical protein